MIYFFTILSFLVAIMSNINGVISCDENWTNATDVGLGYLWFDTSETIDYAAAKRFCRKKNSSLVELETSRQFDFIKMKLKILAEGIDWSYYCYTWRLKKWYAGATEVREGTWMWTQSEEIFTSENFIWGKDQPNDFCYTDQKYLCFSISRSTGNIFGDDCTGDKDNKAYPLCQKKM